MERKNETSDKTSLSDSELLLLIIDKETTEKPVSYDELERIAREGGYDLGEDLGTVRFSYIDRDWDTKAPENDGTTRFERDLYTEVGCGNVDEIFYNGKVHFKLTGLGGWERGLIEEALDYTGTEPDAIPVGEVPHRSF